MFIWNGQNSIESIDHGTLCHFKPILSPTRYILYYIRNYVHIHILIENIEKVGVNSRYLRKLFVLSIIMLPI